MPGKSFITHNHLLFFLKKSTGKKFVTQGKHREFYLDWNVATLPILPNGGTPCQDCIGVPLSGLDGGSRQLGLDGVPPPTLSGDRAATQRAVCLLRSHRRTF